MKTNKLFMKITLFAQNLLKVTFSTSTLIDHNLASFPSKFSQKGVINTSLSDHKLIFCIRKISKFNTDCVHKCINFSSLKN